MITKATRETAEKVVELLSHGLCAGKGIPAPGQMCVEAAVCYAMGLPHSDEPVCVAPAIRAFKIGLNDAAWSSNAARAAGMRRLAIAQLNSEGVVDGREFSRRVAEMTIRKIVPIALRSAAKVFSNQASKDALEAAAVRCETEGSREAAAEAAWEAAWAAATATASAKATAKAERDDVLCLMAENVVQILIDMKAPGTEWLDLAPIVERERMTA